MPRPIVTAKLGTMRKAREWTVNPPVAGREGQIIAQADGAICCFDPNTRKGVLNQKGEYFVHLSPGTGAVPYEFPQDFVDACIAAQPKPGDRIGGMLIIG